VIVKSIAVGDIFLGTTGNRLTVLEIGCEFDDHENRWETSIKYDWFVAGTGISLPVTEKARTVVQMLSTSDFYSQVDASGNVTKSNTIHPTGNSVIQNDFIANAVKYGLSPSDLGRTVLLGETGRTKYQIVGAKPRNRTRPIVVEGASGGLRRFTVAEVKEGLDLYNKRMVRVKVK
jgi:hypothetical protein